MPWLLVLAVGLSAPAPTAELAPGQIHRPAADLDAAVAAVVARHGIVTAGAALIDNGKVVWQGYWGEQSPGVPASTRTRFNVASLTKTVAAETALRLAAQGLLDLDAPLAPHWVDPDVARDPRHARLTARMVLDHTSGFPNWRFFRKDSKLAFVHDPGTRYGYSGEGFEYLARALEHQRGQPFPALVTQQVFKPLGLRTAVLTVQREGLADVARPVDAQGVFPGYYCRPGGQCRAEGSYSAADDLLISVPDYARFLIAVMRAEGYDANWEAARDRIAADKGYEAFVDCATVAPAACPRAQGYGLGFNVIDQGRFKVIGHSGSDWSEMSLAYFYAPSRDGVVLFLNAPNRRALSAMPALIALLDPGSPYLPYYRNWLAREVEKETRGAGTKPQSP